MKKEKEDDEALSSDFHKLIAAAFKGDDPEVNRLKKKVKLPKNYKLYCDEKGNSPLHQACQNGNLNAVRIFLDLEFNAKLANDAGDVPLHIAAREGHKEVVKLLVERCEDCTTVRNNNQGRTAREEATWSEKESTERILRKFDRNRQLSSSDSAHSVFALQRK